MLLDSLITRRLQKYWKGPAFTLITRKRQVCIGSGAPILTVRLLNSWVIDRMAISPSLGFGEAFMNGQITIEGDAMKLLDIGCGWGASLFHAALYYGADVTGVTLAKEQADFIIQKATRLGIADRGMLWLQTGEI